MLFGSGINFYGGPGESAHKQFTLVHPLCVIPDSSGDSDIYFVVLPKCNWS